MRHIRSMLWVLIALPVWVAAAGGENHEGPLENPVPRGAYLRSLELQRFIRQADIPAEFAAVEGPRVTRAVPAVLVRFPDVAAPFARGELQQRVFGRGDAEPSLRQYFLDVSYGRWPIEGRCYGWYELSQARSAYERERSPVVQHYLGIYSMIVEGLQLADQEVDFSLYDVDHAWRSDGSGPDGRVDTMFIVHPFVGHERIGAEAGDVSKFHSHHCSLTRLAEWLEQHNVELPVDPPFVTNDARKDQHGTVVEGPQGPQRVLVDDYILVPALDRAATEDEPARMTSIGVWCHEYGHMLGLPDLYPTRPGAQHFGLGNWCLMAYGGRGVSGETHSHPAPMSAWCRYHLGWAVPQPLSVASVLSLKPIGSSDRLLKIPLPGERDFEEYFLLEFRDPDVEPTRWSVNWDRSLPGPGLAVWHVDESVGRETEIDWPFARAPGQNESVERPLVALEQADQRRHLESSDNRADETDLWRPPALFDDNPDNDDSRRAANARGYDRQPNGIQLELVKVEDEQLHLKFAMQHSATADTSPMPEAAPPVFAAPPEPAARRSRPTVRRERSVEPAVARPLRRAAAKLGRDGPHALEQLSEEERTVLKAAAPRLIERAVPPGRVRDLNQASQQLRTTRLPPNGRGHAELPRAVKKLLSDQPQTQTVSVRLAPDGKTAERIEGLSIHSEQLDPERPPAGKDLTTLLPFSDDQQLTFERVKKSRPDHTTPLKGAVLEYRQVLDHAGERLPVFGTATRLFFDKDGALNVLTADTVPTDELDVSGSFDRIDQSMAVDQVTRQLQVPPSRVNVCQKRIGLADDDPRRARLGFELCISAGEGRRPIHVFVDGETARILYVR